MVAEDLHTGLGVRVVGGLELEVSDAHLVEENLHELHETTQGQAVVGDDTFYLVELGKMCSVDGFVSEDTVDGEVAGGRRAAVGTFA